MEIKTSFSEVEVEESQLLPALIINLMMWVLWLALGPMDLHLCLFF